MEVLINTASLIFHVFYERLEFLLYNILWKIFISILYLYDGCGLWWFLQEVFQCMLRNLFEEFRFFSQYPDRELQTTAMLFGGIIEQGLIT